MNLVRASALKIVPKGLRSFDANDADFFLELLPGPRDREGLPESLRFWKSRIEEKDADKTFSVGLIYGPSGCGKSSLVKAGSAPTPGPTMCRSVYVEATAEETESRLLKGLRRRCPDLPTDLTLSETVASLRRGRGIGNYQKVLLVLDQFEQWLHASEDRRKTRNWCRPSGSAMANGCRPWSWCGRISGFRSADSWPTWKSNWSRDETSALVDLFDRHHARKVLAAFGRAFGALPDAAVQGAGRLSRPGGGGTRPGRQDHFRPPGPVCRDGQGQTLDPGHAAGGRRHRKASASPFSKKPSSLLLPRRSTGCTRRRLREF